VPHVYPTLRYRDAQAAIRFLKEAFGLTEHMVVPGEGGTVRHAQLAWREGLIFLRTTTGQGLDAELGPICLALVVDDPDAHHAHASAHGAEILEPPADAVHGRGYSARDPEGNVWYFGTYAPEV